MRNPLRVIACRILGHDYEAIDEGPLGFSRCARCGKARQRDP